LSIEKVEEYALYLSGHIKSDFLCECILISSSNDVIFNIKVEYGKINKMKSFFWKRQNMIMDYFVWIGGRFVIENNNISIKWMNLFNYLKKMI
jgi:hypothetical protein